MSKSPGFVTSVNATVTRFALYKRLAPKIESVENAFTAIPAMKAGLQRVGAMRWNYW